MSIEQGGNRNDLDPVSGTKQDTIISNQTNGYQTTSIVDPDNANRKGEFDSIFKAPIYIDIDHHEIHDGHMFTFCEVIALANGASQDYIITTPNTTAWCHFGYNVDFNDGAGIFEMYADSDRVGTTLQNVYNRNRNSANTPTTTVHKGQSGGTTDGVLICKRRSGSGKTLSGSASSGSERVLKQNRKYLIRFTNATTSTNNASIEFTWYEHVTA